MRVRNNQRRVVRTGFTLMEILVVVAIIMILAGVGGYYYLKHLDEAKESAAQLQVKTLTQACEAYYTKNGEWPPSLLSLTEKGADGSRPYLEPEAIKTPWQTQYQYDPSGPNNGGNKPDIWAEEPAKGRIGNWSQQGPT
jgi:general secretion pathway protein G